MRPSYDPTSVPSNPIRRIAFLLKQAAAEIKFDLAAK